MSLPQDHPDDRRCLYRETEPRQAPGAETSELDRVMEETLARLTVDHPLSAEEKEALLRVARRHQDAPAPLEAVVPELVTSLLHLRLQPLQLPSETWFEMCSQIAESLLDAPHARVRLEHLWTQLCESL